MIQAQREWPEPHDNGAFWSSEIDQIDTRHAKARTGLADAPPLWIARATERI